MKLKVKQNKLEPDAPTTMDLKPIESIIGEPSAPSDTPNTMPTADADITPKSRNGRKLSLGKKGDNNVY